MTERDRTSLYLTTDLVQRAKRLFDEMPGQMSVSRFVDQYLGLVVPRLEDVWEHAKQGDRDAMMALLDRTLLDGMGQATDVRTKLLAKAQEESAT